MASGGYVMAAFEPLLSAPQTLCVQAQTLPEKILPWQQAPMGPAWAGRMQGMWLPHMDKKEP